MKTINVTQEHIDKGVKSECDLCPVALALKDAVPFINTIVVGCGFAYLNNIKYQLPNTAIFIESFDCGYKVYPFSFELDI